MTFRRRIDPWLDRARGLAWTARRRLSRNPDLLPKHPRPAFPAIKARLATRAFDRWPTRTESPNRLEPEAWPVIRPKWSLHGARSVYTIGSCFARNIEEHFARAGFDVPTLRFQVPRSEWRHAPNGIMNKYTPPSIAQELEWALRVRRARSERARAALLAEPLLGVDGGLFIDVELAGYGPVTRERGVERRRQLYETVEHAFASDVVTITLGLVEAWWDGERRRFIQQVPSPALTERYRKRFAFAPLRYAEALAHTRQAIDLLVRHGKPGLKVLLTTSPVPLRTTFLLQDAIVANTYGKSILRAVCGEVAADYDAVDYFPSYESAMLSEAGRVWKDDRLHVDEAFIAKIVAHLVDPYFAPGTAAGAPDAAPELRLAPAAGE